MSEIIIPVKIVDCVNCPDSKTTYHCGTGWHTIRCYKLDLVVKEAHEDHKPIPNICPRLNSSNRRWWKFWRK